MANWPVPKDQIENRQLEIGNIIAPVPYRVATHVECVKLPIAELPVASCQLASSKDPIANRELEIGNIIAPVLYRVPAHVEEAIGP